ncbi:hypothetical protein B0H16DRAFT_1345483 [Mycena metata]|uniref:Uncharacterized protein n=1 Tax=Mycena metata TaxID=1033252 RepID=A0AAD7M9K9_9AGAR|nr:hypothetical protein B0H16DRAFT_1345483 [Mycena metata]
MRAKRLTWKLLQQLPPAPAEFEDVQPSEPDDDATPPPAVSPFVWESVKTVKNSFGIYREYPSVPTHDPDRNISLADQSNIPAPAPNSSAPIPGARLSLAGGVAAPGFVHPFKNSTIFGFMNWMWSGSIMKSMAEVQRLIDFIVSDDFKKEDLIGFNLRAETAKFDRTLGGGVTDALGNASGVKDGWKEVDVEITVPDGEKHAASDPLPKFSVRGLHFRNLTQTIKSALQDRSTRFFHYTPFKQFWQRSSDDPPQRIYDELYSSPAFIRVHEKVQRLPAELNCTLERVVAALMFWSDSTHLANFGTASLWPVYLFFGNQSKWVRGKPRAGACHHVAYMPKVSRFQQSQVNYRSSQSLDSCQIIFSTGSKTSPAIPLLLKS